MNKKILLYIITIFNFLLLQSCVSNYVVSKPTAYSKPLVPMYNRTPNRNTKKTEKNTLLPIDNRILTQEELADNENYIEYNNKIHNIMDEALTYLGTPYRLGGTSRRGIDCSAFVLSVYANAMGVSLPRVSSSQALEGEIVDRNSLKKGDLVFFAHHSRISHVGIVYDVEPSGEVKFIHSATSKGVTVSSLSDKYWAPKFRIAKRILNDYGIQNVNFTDYANN